MRQRLLGDLPRERIPPGQTVTDGFPVLQFGSVPTTDLSNCDFHVFGLVQQPLRFAYDDILAMPRHSMVVDIHCVSSLLQLVTQWEGITFREFMGRVQPSPEAGFVSVHTEAGFTTSLPIDVLMDEDVMLAYNYEHARLTRKHG